MVWNQHLSALLPTPDIMDDKLIGGVAFQSAQTRPDNAWVRWDRVVVLEIDEHSHQSYDVECELKKLDSTNYGFDTGVKRPVVVIRFNPDEYDRSRIGLADRCFLVAAKVTEFLECDVKMFDLLRANVVYMFYHTNGEKHINAAKKAIDSIVVI